MDLDAKIWTTCSGSIGTAASDSSALWQPGGFCLQALTRPSATCTASPQSSLVISHRVPGRRFRLLQAQDSDQTLNSTATNASRHPMTIVVCHRVDPVRSVAGLNLRCSNSFAGQHGLRLSILLDRVEDLGTGVVVSEIYRHPCRHLVVPWYSVPHLTILA